MNKMKTENKGKTVKKRQPEGADGLNNRSKQLNPNNEAYRKSRENNDDAFIDTIDTEAGIPDGGFLD